MKLKLWTTIHSRRNNLGKLAAVNLAVLIAPMVSAIIYYLLFSVIHVEPFPWPILIVLAPQWLVSTAGYSLALLAIIWIVMKFQPRMSLLLSIITAVASMVVLLIYSGYFPSTHSEVGFTGITVYDSAGIAGALISGTVYFFLVRRISFYLREVTNR